MPLYSGIEHRRQASSQFPGRKPDVWLVCCSGLFRGRNASVFSRGEEHAGFCVSFARVLHSIIGLHTHDLLVPCWGSRASQTVGYENIIITTGFRVQKIKIDKDGPTRKMSKGLVSLRRKAIWAVNQQKLRKGTDPPPSAICKLRGWSILLHKACWEARGMTKDYGEGWPESCPTSRD